MGYRITTPDPPRFPDEFALAWEGDSDPDGGRYIGVLNQVLERLKGQFDRDPAPDQPSEKARLDYRLAAHKATLTALRADATLVVAGTLSPAEAALRAPVWLGRHDLRVERFEGTLFRSTLIHDKADKTLAVDLDISITEGLPAPQDKPLPAQQALFAEIGSALTVVKTVYESSLDRYAARAQSTNDARWEREQRRAQLKLDKYVRDLKGIADVGLKDGFVDMAVLALASLKAEFVSMEAPRIKNDYIWNLGKWAAGFALLALAVSLLSVRVVPAQLAAIVAPALAGIYPFAVASIGAAIGTWLSFSIRRVSLSFEQLAVPEEDMLHPAFRVLFVLGLTLVVMLIFFTGVMNVEIGGLKTTSFAGLAGKIEAVSLLVGLFCGIAERGLSSAVSLRATDFVSSIGGAKRS